MGVEKIGPHKVKRQLSQNSYEIEIAAKTVGNKNYAAKTKNVSTRHLRPYQPFDDNFDDTSPKWIVNDDDLDENTPTEMKAGMYCIIPHYCWIDIENDNMPFCLGKVEHIDKTNNNVQIRRYGNNTHDIYGFQQPGWLHVKSRTTSPKSEYRKTQKSKEHSPYTSKFNIKGKMNYDYPIRLDWILYFGFELKNGTIPENILRKLSNDPDIPFNDFDLD